MPSVTRSARASPLPHGRFAVRHRRSRFRRVANALACAATRYLHMLKCFLFIARALCSDFQTDGSLALAWRQTSHIPLAVLSVGPLAPPTLAERKSRYSSVASPSDGRFVPAPSVRY